MSMGDGSGFLGGGGRVRIVQRSTIAITGAVSATATVTSVDPNNALLNHLGSTNSGGVGTNSQYIFTRLSLTNATTVTATVGSDPGANTVTTPFELTEFTPGLFKSNVQRGTLAVGAGTATITSVDTTKSNLQMLGFTTTNANGNASPTPRIVLTNATTITITVVDSQSQIAGYQVAEGA